MRTTLTARDSTKRFRQNFSTFFYDQPSGQGAGLGLSLSYNIIKVHGGDLKVDTKEGEYAEFIVTLRTSY